MPQLEQVIASNNVIPLLQTNENVQCTVDGTNTNEQRGKFNLKSYF
jgi:hypothetical protein